MRKQVYISADYSEIDGDKNVVDELNKWGNDDYHRVDFVDMSQVASGSVSKDSDCRICDLKAEFNRQINASSSVIFIVGNMTRYRIAGQSCGRHGKTTQWESYCTPYKQNTNGTKMCKYISTVSVTGNNIGNINNYSYLRHEFEQAVRQKKNIIILYNSMRYESFGRFFTLIYEKSLYLALYILRHDVRSRGLRLRRGTSAISGNSFL